MATVKELRELSREELLGRAADLKKQVFEMKNKHNTGVLDSTADLLKTRREIARVLTVAREGELRQAKAGVGEKA